MSEYILEMKEITKEFTGSKALDRVNLKVKRGEVHGLCGENGAGKSTLMKVLSGIYPYGAYSGQIIYEGSEIKLHNTKESENMGIAIIHQELALVQQLSVAENIFVGSEVSKRGIIKFHEMYGKANKLLTDLNLKINPQTLIKDLGIGHQQLIEIAKALSKNAKLLILDEPTASLSDNEIEILKGIIRHLKSKGVTCIYISHKLNEVMELTDTVTILRDGQTIGTEETGNLTQDKIIQMMVGREMKNLYPREEHFIGEEILEVNNFNVYSPVNPDRRVVKDISFKLKKGEILGIAGLIGSGRTELVSSIFGTYSGKKSGDVLLEGKKIKLSSSSDALKHGISMVPEDRKGKGIVGIMSVKENITLSNISKYRGTLNSINASKEIVDVRKYIEDLKIKASSMGMQVRSLSGGNQQKVVLSKNLLVDPKILILDEPTRGIDVGAKWEIYKLMFELVKKGISIIMVSSELPEVLGISDRVLVLNQGELKGDLVNKDLTQEMVMKCAIGGN